MKQENQENEKETFEETVVSFSQTQIEEIKSEAKKRAKGYHQWVQKGNFIVCKSCPNRHAFEIGRKILMGLDEDGKPILKDRSEVFKK